jgi:hypothetical protein
MRIDLVISPSEGEFELLPNIGTSDHMALKISLDLGMKGIKIPEITGRKVYHWSSANFREMNAELKRCSFDFERLSVQESVDLVTHTLCELTDKYVPSVMISGTAKPTAWWTPYCQWAWERKQRAFIGGCKVGIMRATKCCVQVCRRAFAKHQLRLKIRLQRAKGSKKFWQTFKLYSGIGGGKRRKVTPPAVDLAKHFATKMSLPGEELREVPPLEPAPPGSRKLRGFKISIAGVSKILGQLDVNKSVGPDGVSPRVLKHCARHLTRPLALLFRKIADAGEFPQSWKVARVTAIYKKNDATLPANYRPVSVLPTLATTFERVLMPQLSSFLIEHIPPNQFGFLPGTGTLDVGVILADQISRALEARKDVRLVALDFKGAFDKVWWRGLLAHLWAVGVRSKAYKLFESYLSDRSLFVVSNGQKSDPVTIRSGVPQGAIWSPLLFNLFVRNVPQRVKEATCLFYADDVTLLQIIDRSKVAARNARRDLNEDLRSLFRFGKEWLLEFEPSKSSGLTISNLNEARVKHLHSPCRMGGHEVKEVEELEALGFIIDKKGNWAKFAEATASAARQRLGALRRLSPLLDDDSITMAYKAFVRSKIEYGSLVYWGAAEGYLKKFDGIQRSAISLLQQPQQVGPTLPSLESRRQAAAVGLTCKLLDGRGRGLLNDLKPTLVNPGLPSPEVRVSARIASRTVAPQHSHQLEHAQICHRAGPRSSLAPYKRSYRVRIPDIWNNIQHDMLHQSHIEEYMPIRKMLQRQVKMGGNSSG